MTLIIEDGTIVTDADSFASVTDLEAYATNYGVTLPAGKEALLRKAMDYLARYTEKWKGLRVSDDQELDWPRTGVYVDYRLLPSDEIPRQLFYAQLKLAVTAIDTDLLPVSGVAQQGAVLREKVDVLEVEYANPGRILPVPSDADADAQIRVLLKYSGLQVIRA